MKVVGEMLASPLVMILMPFVNGGRSIATLNLRRLSRRPLRWMPPGLREMIRVSRTMLIIKDRGVLHELALEHLATIMDKGVVIENVMENPPENHIVIGLEHLGVNMDKDAVLTNVLVIPPEDHIVILLSLQKGMEGRRRIRMIRREKVQTHLTIWRTS